MEDNGTILDEIKKITGITNFKNISKDDVQKIFKMIGEQKLNEKHIEALIKNYPHFIQAEIEALKSIQKVTQSAECSQKEVLVTISKSIEGITSILDKLADKSESDETRLKIAQLTIEVSKLYLEFTKELRGINNDNNNFWIKIASIVCGILVMAVGILLASLAGGGNKEE